MNLVLIGYRGTGKTTVAQQLALRLGWDWVDTDVEVELRAGRSIATIFAESGEAAFRDLEALVLAEQVKRAHIVIAAGGGAVLREENRRVLAATAHVVWLTARVDTITSRVAADTTTASRRPNLRAGGETEIRELLAERAPLYRACAAIDVATDERSAAEIVDEICARLSLAACGQEGT